MSDGEVEIAGRTGATILHASGAPGLGNRRSDSDMIGVTQSWCGASPLSCCESWTMVSVSVCLA